MMKKLSMLFVFLAILLSWIMCFVVGYNYGLLKNVINSAPTYVAFLYAIPFLIAIIVCLIIAYTFYKKNRQEIFLPIILPAINDTFY